MHGCQAFSQPTHPLRQPTQLAEGVEFPEKNAGFASTRTPFGGGGVRIRLITTNSASAEGEPLSTGVLLPAPYGGAGLDDE